jgi:hypothetical protein
MNTFQLYRTWNTLLTQWIPSACRTQRTNLAWLIVGLYLARRVHLSAIVKKWPLGACVPSLVRRLSRFLDNPAVRVAIWYRPVARRILERWRGQTLTLIIDATKVGFGHQLIMVAVAYRRRALPVAWCWVPWRRGHTPTETQVTVLRRVQRLVPPDVGVILTGDAGFGSVRLLRQVQAWGWDYVLRQKGNHLVCAARQRRWQPFQTLVTQPDRVVWWENARFTKQWEQRTHLYAYQRRDAHEAWLLTTSLPDARTTHQTYARRMWIEELFGDLKGHGVDLETTHLRQMDRLSRLTFAVCLLYVWLLFLGLRTIRAGWRTWVDRHDRRDLSVARIGADLLERCLTLARRPPIGIITLVSGG